MKYNGELRIKREHRLVLEALEQTPTLQHGRFRGVVTLLFAIASHYPNACPGQRTLSRECYGVSASTIKRWVRWAVEEGWLIVLPDEGLTSKQWTSKSNRYIIPILHEAVEHEETMTPRHGTTVTPRHGVIPTPEVRSTTCSLPPKDPPGRKTSSSSPTERATSGRTTVSAVAKNREPGESDAEFRQRVAAGAGTKRLAVRPRQSERSPAQRTATLFATAWTAMVEENPEFKDIRPWESKGMTTGYLNSVFFYPEAGRVYEEDEVRSFIEDFIEAVRTSRVVVKAGQSAFMRFTGWWGRSDWSSVQEDERPFMG